MNQEPKRLLQDAAVDPSLRAELAAFGEHCATQPFDLHAGLARFESAAAATAATTSTATAATTTAVATSSKGLSAVLGAKGLAWATGALLSASAVTWTVWPEPTPEPTTEARSAQSIEANTPKALPQPPTEAPKPALKQPGPNSALQAELRVIKQARQALAQGQNTKALTILNKAQTRFPQGALIPERKALTIIALFKTGNRPKARRQARSFLTKHPDSPMAAKIRRMLRGAKR